MCKWHTDNLLKGNWNAIEQSEHARTLFDEWREDNCLKTMDDWESWKDYYESAASTSRKGIKVTEECSMVILLRVFCELILVIRGGGKCSNEL